MINFAQVAHKIACKTILTLIKVYESLKFIY